MFYCSNGAKHQHSSVYESKVCWGVIAPARPTPVVPPAPAVRMISPRQKTYLLDLGFDAFNDRWTYDEASAKITELTRQPRRTAVTVDPRLEMVKALIDLVPNGYYAVQREAGAHIDFLRISRPTKKQYAGTIKVQTQHGSGYGRRLDVEAVLWPSGKWSVYKSGVIDMLLLLVADQHTAAVRYAEKLGCCMRCTADLTDRRSRHYGIGPECETKPGWGWVIEEKDDRAGGSFEYLAARGLVTVND